MQTLRRPHVPVMLIVLAALVAACSSSGPSSSPIPAGPLLTVEARGGHCFAPPCGATIVIERDGTVHSADTPPNQLGTLPVARLTALAAAIQTTNFDFVKSRPFTGECPIAFDGQEFVFEFGAPTGVVRIASCETEVDYTSPLFATVATALSEYMPLPVP